MHWEERRMLISAVVGGFLKPGKDLPSRYEIRTMVASVQTELVN